MANTLYDFANGTALSTVRDASTIEVAARAGYAAKGLVYVTLGALTLMAVLGFASGEISGTRGALEMFNEQWWGPFVLAITAAGLVSFALWRAFQAIKDTDDKGNDASGLARRAGLLISGGIYASLALYAIKLLFDMSNTSGGADQRAAEVMAQDGGTMAIGLLAVGIIGVGLYQLYRVVTSQFKDHWKTAQMSEAEERTATLVSRFGIGARAVAFVLIGLFMGWGAATGQPDKAQGMQGTLSDVAQHPFGQTLVGIAGTGLICYGLYCFVNALFRRIDAGDQSAATQGHQAIRQVEGS